MSTSSVVIDKQIAIATKGLQPFIAKRIKALPQDQLLTLLEYIAAMEIERHPTTHHRKAMLQALLYLSGFHANKPYMQMTRADVLAYLSNLQKPEEIDPLHKWIGTYNLRLVLILQFFKWLYNPHQSRKERKRPDFLKNIAVVRRKEESIYTPNDLWTQADDLLFLKYCPRKDIKCYHTMSRDMSARPHEILKLNIEQVVNALRELQEIQYGEVTVSGKTKQRPLPLYNSVPYIKDWLNEHPYKDNPKAPLFVSTDGPTRGQRMKEDSLYRIYSRYKEGVHTKNRHSNGYFQTLLKNPSVTLEERRKIEALLQKPWNPYIRRHTALTEKQPMLNGLLFNQHGGWAPGSKMPQKYVHYFGGESASTILQAVGVIKKEKTMTEILRPVQCSNCKHPNKLDASFCAQCEHPLNFKATQAAKEKAAEKDKKLADFEQQLAELRKAKDESDEKLLDRLAEKLKERAR